MPCACWYVPDDASNRLIKYAAQMIVDEIKLLERDGDPLGISLEKTIELLRHLYRPEICKENPRN